MKYDVIVIGAGAAGAVIAARVSDASVMPKCPRANIHLTTVMIGERAGEWLREGVV